jgi:hypothetical protein
MIDHPLCDKLINHHCRNLLQILVNYLLHHLPLHEQPNRNLMVQ